MPGLRSLRNRLAVIFALIIAGAIGTIYLSVTPRLEASLTAQRLNSLTADSKRYLKGIARELPVNDPTLVTVDARAPKAVQKAQRRRNASASRQIRAARDARARATRRAADQSGAEVIAYTIAPQGPYAVADSKSGGVSTRDVGDLAVRAIETKREVTRTGPTSAGRQAMVAQPTFDEDGKISGAAVFASSLGDVQDNVALIRRQVLLSGGIALVIAVLAGYLVARALAARVKRLERAARKVAAGDFSQPIRADSDDELGRLAAAFDDMQAQLARLDRARKQFIAAASHELGRRSSRSAGSSSCSPTRTSTRRRGARSSSRSARRSTASASSRPTCSTCRAWRRARSSCGPSRPTSRTSAGWSRSSSRPPRLSRTPS